MMHSTRTTAARHALFASVMLLIVLFGSKSGRAQGCSSLSFGPPHRIDLPGAAFPMVASDLDGDGKIDLAILTQQGAALLLGNGDGSLRPPLVISGNIGSTFAVADFNGDGKPDLVTSGTFTNWIFLGNGDGTFVGRPSEAPTWNVVGDFNLDGKPDLAGGWQNQTNVFVYLNKGDGTFRPAVSYQTEFSDDPPEPLVLAVGDLNGDGFPDLVRISQIGVRSEFKNKTFISTLLNNGDGTFHPGPSQDAGAVDGQPLLADFNRDGKADLLVRGDGLLSLFMGNGDGTFQPAVTSPGLWVLGGVSDLNGDGNLDLIMFNGQVMLGDGDGTFQAPAAAPIGASVDSLVVGDFNGDGKPDLATSKYSSIDVFLNTCGYSVFPENGLAITRANAAVDVSWPLSLTGFVLESTTNLNAANWQAALETPGTNKGHWHVQAPANDSQR